MVDVREVLAAAVEQLGGEERPGQIAMAEAVAEAMESKRHLLVQAGTGTGKSLGYLVPALLHRDRVVVATATLALQHQLVERDINIAAICANRYKSVILGGGSQHGRATNVDIFYAGVEILAGGNCFLERVEINVDQIDRQNTMLCSRVSVFFIVTQV